MDRWKKVFVLVMVPLFLLTAGIAPVLGEPTASDSDITPVSIFFDFCVLRPLGLVATTLGTTLFLVTYPVNILQNNTKQVGRTIVVEPAIFTFKRPLGELP